MDNEVINLAELKNELNKSHIFKNINFNVINLGYNDMGMFILLERNKKPGTEFKMVVEEKTKGQIKWEDFNE